MECGRRFLAAKAIPVAIVGVGFIGAYQVTRRTWEFACPTCYRWDPEAGRGVPINQPDEPGKASEDIPGMPHEAKLDLVMTLTRLELAARRSARAFNAGDVPEGHVQYGKAKEEMARAAGQLPPERAEAEADG